MRSNVERWQRDWYRKNIQMVMLCALCSVSLLVSPLVPYVFDLGTASGMALFATAFLAIAAPLGWIGVSLNRMAAYHQRVTARTVRAALFHPWRR